MSPLEIVVLVGGLVVLSTWIAPHARIAVPLVQVMLGVLAGFFPVVRDIHLPSETVLVLFLPALLFWEAATTSLREIRRDLRTILPMSTLLVAATAFGVAGIAVALGLGWPAALVLGAALAPTDATAVGVLTRSLPHRNVTLLRAESLVNDGTALVIYAITVGVAVSHVAFDGWRIVGLISLSYLGGAAVGVTVGLIGTVVLRRLRDAAAHTTAMIFIPFAAFLAAESIDASGVIAVVVAGVILSQTGPRTSTPLSRQQSSTFWTLTTRVLNGALFVLIGIEAQSAIRAVPAAEIPSLVAVTALAWIAILVIRFVFQVLTAWMIRLLDRRPSQRTHRMSHRARVVSTVAGFRGAVSLAVAIAVPAGLGARSEIIFVAAGVVVLTIVVQGVLLPVVIRWARFAPDTTTAAELAEARRAATIEVVRSAPELATAVNVSDEVRDRVVLEYQHRLQQLGATDGSSDYIGIAEDEEHVRLTLAILERKRSLMIRLRDQHVISDTTLRILQT
ncbi:MAG TPA: Na+/H+ antiporter, partial [Microbacterium sp.]|uniref:Na+/H+ antiporter n=1 Tax=Microbacterium sp. TaxID=51671 RepID=UPI002B466DE9